MAPQLLPASQRARLIFGALVAVLAIGIAYGAGYFGPRLTAPDTNSPEAGFARDMSQHHAQAVEMAMLAVRLASNDEIRTMAYDIATSQEYQIGQMQSWLEDWHLSLSRSKPAMSWMPGGSQLSASGLMPGMASDAEIDKLRASTGQGFDILFCQLMLRHHLGGVHMAEEVLNLTGEARVRTMAQTVITAQRTEITILENLLQQMGARPLQ